MFREGVIEEAPELVVSVSIVASEVTFKRILLLFEPLLICYERKPRVFLSFLFIVVGPFLPAFDMP